MNGASEMAARLRSLAAAFPDRVGAALFKRGGIVLTEAKRRCPVAADGGELRASGLVSEPERDGNKVTVTLSFGGAADAYAIAVHEHLSEHSPHSWQEHPNDINWTTPGTGPKFLEGPINEAEQTLLADLAEDLKL